MEGERAVCWGRAAAVGLVLGIVSVLVSGVGLASEGDGIRIDGVAWWWRAQNGEIRVPPPPTVPDGGLVVGAGGSEATEVGALRFRGVDEEAGGRLVLGVEQGSGSGDLLVCPTSSTWSSVQAGAWEEAPDPRCEDASEQGEEREGDEWHFVLEEVGPFMGPSGELNIMVLPKAMVSQVDEASAFRVVFERVDDGALQQGEVTFGSEESHEAGGDGETADRLGGVPREQGPTGIEGEGANQVPGGPGPEGPGGLGIEGEEEARTESSLGEKRRGQLAFGELEEGRTAGVGDSQLGQVVGLLLTVVLVGVWGVSSMRGLPTPVRVGKRLGPVRGEADGEEGVVGGIGPFRRRRRGIPGRI